MPKMKSRQLSVKDTKANICHRVGCISAYGMCDLHMCEGSTDTEVYIGIFLRDICCHQDDILSWEVYGYFSKIMPSLILHAL